MTAVHVSEFQRTILLNDFLRRGASQKCRHHRIERDSRTTNSNHAFRIDIERRLFGFDY